ncbi:PREDICTED: uncharacterized protein LOC109177113 isoform X3 [Ipomoea nil]|uniref:uncharacterized protein LOC109177113 isoform X3 n=1 Tax=Ipomoea nil TaxID=35883 RepID=UPI000901E9E9|nr:PREDICTED: uncharacterized protein LOC109177113 isoform X3 [Ipomoea nil]
MSGPPREKSVNHAESEVRPVLGPAGNKARSLELRKPAEKLKSNKVEKSPESDGGKKKSSVIPAAAAEGGDQLSKPRFQVATSKKCGSVGSVLRRQQEQRSFLASSESSQSQASTGNISLDSVTPRSSRRRQCGPKTAEKAGSEVESLSMSSDDFPLVKKRCAWVTTNTDPLYAAFHDEEWGVPVHDDRNLFELLSLSTALAELSWPTILSRRQAFKEVFQNFDPVAVSKLNEKKITVPGNPASSLLSELKLRAIIENARHVCKIIDEIGSFDKYVWGFVNHRPIVGQFRYPRQVPIKTSKAEAISKDLVRRGFRGVGPTVIYSFMQVSGITNDHLISCFRFHECMAWGNARNKGDSLSAAKLKVKQPEDDDAELGLVRAIDNSSLST